ncbi:MAG: aminotransferase class V-fold PLP-dependent enzyme, partial [Vulcanimicrobiota bacterium]
AGAKILIDAAQLLAHAKIDMKPDDDPEHIDFVAAAGHKAYAPFGSAFLVGPREIFDAVDPYVPGGGTVEFVTPNDAVWAPSPDRHQFGTPNIAGAIAMAESLKFLESVGMEEIRQHEKKLYEYTVNELSRIDGVTIYGPKDPEKCIGVISFNVHYLPNELIAAILNYEANIATRNGCFCAHPYIQFLLNIQKPMQSKEKFDKGIIDFLPGAVRATIGIYNTKEEMDELIRMVDIISKRKWRGEYDIEATTMCTPVAFKPRGEGKGYATCIDENKTTWCSG